MEDPRDLALALEIHNRLNNRFGITENAVITEHMEEKDYEPRTLVDNTLELIDPTPNIHTLFVEFNSRYFWDKLQSIEVKWSNRMTTCAGVCSFHPKNRQCVITLSVPLLKLRSRKDLVETLLHEMIHGYLFLTHNTRDRDGHGPEFHKHMYRINREAGTQITVYHNFHNEVKLYQQHWWCCNGPCKKKAPYFGTVRRAMNRAPGPNDTWWKTHQKTCGGQFIKVREPMKKPAKNEKVTKETNKKVPTILKSKDISDWLTKTDKAKSSATEKTNLPTKNTAGKSTENSVTTTKNPSTFAKLGNTSNNIHGWGVGGPNSSDPIPSTSKGGLNSPKFHAAGVLGGSRSGKSNLLDKFPSTKISVSNKWINSSETTNGSGISSKNAIIDLDKKSKKRKGQDSNINGDKLPKIKIRHLPENANCPICNEAVSISVLNDHLDECLVSESSSDKNQGTKESPLNPDSDENNSPQDSIISCPIVISDSDGSEGVESPSVIDNRQKCLVCKELIEPGITLNDHLETCIGVSFMDDAFPELEDDKNSDSSQSSEKNFPCPLCMAIIHESLMNEHLMICLSADPVAE